MPACFAALRRHVGLEPRATRSGAIPTNSQQPRQRWQDDPAPVLAWGVGTNWARGGVVRLLLSLALLAGCGSDDDNGDSAAEPRPIAVLSAFPAELASVLAQAEVEETQVVEGRIVRTGTIGGVPVVMAMTGIGLLNAAATTNIILDNFDVVGVVVSGVAGSPRRVGDVVVPRSWSELSGEPFPTDPQWLARIQRLARAGRFALERCTTVRNDPVCLGFDPQVFVEGAGSSSDDFGALPFKCSPNGGAVFGCDVPNADDVPRAAAVQRLVHAAQTATDPEEPSSVDMETAAIGAAATRHGVPYVAFRAVSDGAQDPLNLPGFPAQFFAYYPLAAENAARAAATFVADLKQ
jgi:nucleoside phosphorylase